MMLLNSEGRPCKERLKAYMEVFSAYSSLSKKKDRSHILAMEAELSALRKEEEQTLYKKYHQAEHKRVQRMLDKGEAKYTELLAQEVNQFKLLYGEESKGLVKLTRCPSPSPVKATEALNKHTSTFLSRQYLDKALNKSFGKAASQSDGEDEQILQTIYEEVALDEMSRATKVEELYKLADKLIGVTAEGCKDLINLK